MPAILTGIHSLDQHLSTFLNDPDHYRPSRCPQCGKSGLWLHGVYYRRAQCQAPDRATPIQRFYCRHCQRTCSTLPEYLPPRRWYVWWVQQLVLQLLAAGKSLMASWAAACDALPQAPSLSTIHRWWQHSQQRFVDHRWHLSTADAALGLATSCAQFWHTYFTGGTLSQAMASLHRAGHPIP